MSGWSNAALALAGAVTLAAAVVADGADEARVPLEFSGGHDIGGDDHGRPVVLIAAALGVKPEQFREAFRGVTPAKGRPPSAAEARRNKDALMRALGPLGVTNRRLDEVSDHYRYRPQAGELWKAAPARGYATVEGGKVKRVVITDPGSGYSSPPTVTARGVGGAKLKATLHFSTDLRKNGSVAAVEPEPDR